jgi:hypothetical protein
MEKVMSWWDFITFNKNSTRLFYLSDISSSSSLGCPLGSHPGS